MKDIESEVKIAALQSLIKTMSIISVEKTQNLIFPAVNSLVSDTGVTTGVKTALANVLASMSHLLGRDFTTTKIIPLALSLLNEENHEIKLVAIKGLADLAEIVGGEILTPSLVE